MPERGNGGATEKRTNEREIEFRVQTRKTNKKERRKRRCREIRKK